MFWLLFNKISSHLGALEQVTKLFLKGIQMEILTFMTHIMQQTTVGILSNGFGENKVPNQVISMV